MEKAKKLLISGFFAFSRGVRTYEYLQNQGVVYNKRGIGFFVASDAGRQVQQLRRARFLEQELPDVFRTMRLLDLSLDEVARRYVQFTATYQVPASLPSPNSNGHENQQ